MASDDKKGASGTEVPYAPAYPQQLDVNHDVYAPEKGEPQELPVKPQRSFLLRQVFWALRYFGVVVVVAALLVIPVAVKRDSAFTDDADPRSTDNLIFYLFLWLLVTWLAGTLADLAAMALPYVYRLLARYFNPAHQKYWRVFRALRRPIRFLGTVAFGYIAFAILINYNPELAVNFNKTADAFTWDDALDDILEQATLWVCFYFVEKIMMLYITIHSHYRFNHKKIQHSKDMHEALMVLYEASTYLHPVNGGQFPQEDLLIRNAKGSLTSSARVGVTSYLARMGIDGYKLAGLFGNFVDDDPRSHWLRPGSTYATVERALSDPRSAAALARRIWVSLVVQNAEGLTADDVAEVLGPFRKDEAASCFDILDENETGEIRLDEMVMTVVEAGRIRHDIYQHMHDTNHCLNTFDWVCQLILGATMVFFILVAYVPTIKQVQQTLSFVALGLAFAVGRTFNHFLAGALLVFFDHPFDIGDRVDVYNMAASISVACVVKRQSLLYTVFRRMDNGVDLQISNERLLQKRTENFSRSGVNRQGVSLFVSFKTSFEDIVYLRQELEAFVAENKRDYMPDLAVSVVNLHELNKIEIKCSVAHKSNWGNEKLRASRSNRFYLALVAAIRKIPLDKPGGALSTGEEGKPMFTVPLTDAEGVRQMQTAAANRTVDRIDSTAEPSAQKLAAREKERVALAKLQRRPPPEKSNTLAASTAIEVNEFIGISTTGLRQKHGGGGDVLLRQFVGTRGTSS